MPNRRLILASLAALFVAFAGGARADAPMFYSDGSTAINGYDTVAYFTQGEPVRGSSKFAVMWKGAVWFFANMENRDTFEANPRAYAPQYGGYCAYAVSLGYRDATNPDAWHIENGKLYLTRTRAVRTVWAFDIPGNIARADGNWPMVLGD